MDDKPDIPDSFDDRRVFFFLMVLFLTFAISGWFFLGPGADRQTGRNGRIKLIVATPSPGRGDMPEQLLAEEFMARHPEIDVEIRPILGNYYQKLLIMIAGGIAPDLMWMGQSFNEFADRGAFLDISDRLAEIDTGMFLPQVLEWYRRDGRQFAIPYGIDLIFLAYNKHLFNEAGVTYPTPEWDFKEFIEKTQRLTVDRDGDGRIDQYGFRAQLDPSLFGAQFLSPDGRKATCNTPEMIDFLQTNLDLVHRYKICPHREEIHQQGLDAFTLFRQGRAAIQRLATWDLARARERWADLDWDICVNPRVRRSGHWASSNAYCISAQTRHPDHAWELMKIYFSPKFQKLMASRNVPTNQQVAREMIAGHRGKPQNLRALIQATESLCPFPRVPNLDELKQYWQDGCSQVWTRQASPAQVMALVEKQINRAIANTRHGRPPRP